MRIKTFCLLILMAVGFWSCGKGSEPRGLDFNLTIQPDMLTDFLYIKMDYNYHLSEDFKGLGKDYAVFVHFWRTRSKEMLVQDDHVPEVLTTQWRPGQKLEYSRTLFIPKFLDEIDIDFEGYEEIRITVGLWDPDSSEDEKILLYRKNVKIHPASVVAPEIVYAEGWNNVETDPGIENPKEQHWQWTTKKAVCVIENPKRESTLIIRGGVDKAKIADQKVIFRVNDQLLEEFIPETAKFEKRYTLTPEQMGNDYEFRFTIETDKAFVPAMLNPQNSDKRELGVQIYFLYFREALK
ncbi:MAG: hypothetical protein RB296_09145 [Acidobacteriota bacterium]|jgi:hypothetical protein|nr:hypothetical protein [Acidobacteriota bacterium]